MVVLGSAVFGAPSSMLVKAGGRRAEEGPRAAAKACLPYGRLLRAAPPPLQRLRRAALRSARGGCLAAPIPVRAALGTSTAGVSVYKSLKGATSPFKKGRIQVSDVHEIEYRVHGNPEGIPAVVLHGGPGAGCYPKHARFFDPEKYMVVLIDQRGCGASTPRGGLEGNTTWDLVADMEKVREELGIDKWLLLGGSWGVALALAYGTEHPGRCSGIILRGVCTMRPQEVSWMYRRGASALVPSGWKSFVEALDEGERGDPLTSYYARLCDDTKPEGLEAAASAWFRWEMAVGFSGLGKQLQRWDGKEWVYSDPPAATPEEAAARVAGLTGGGGGGGGRRFPPPKEGEAVTYSENQLAGDTPPPPPPPPPKDPDAPPTPSMSSTASQARLECFYSYHGAFFGDKPLIERVGVLREAGVPCLAVQGRLDFICPVQTAFELHEAWPEMELVVVPGAGHSMYDTGIQHELLCATERFDGAAFQPVGEAAREEVAAAA